MTVDIDQIRDGDARMLLRAAVEIAARGEPVELRDRGVVVAVVHGHVPLDGELLAVTRQPYDENGHEIVEMGWEHDCG